MSVDMVDDNEPNVMENNQKLDEMFNEYEIGNEVPFPKTLADLDNYCLKRGSPLISSDKFARDVKRSIKLIIGFKPIARTISIVATEPEYIKQSNMLCKYKNLTIIEAINAKRLEARELKLNYTYHIYDLIQDGPKDKSFDNFLCVTQKYMNQTIDLQSEAYVQEIIREWYAPLYAILAKSVKYLSTPEIKYHISHDCQVLPPRQPSPQPLQSFVLAMLKALDAFAPNLND